MYGLRDALSRRSLEVSDVHELRNNRASLLPPAAARLEVSLFVTNFGCVRAYTLHNNLSTQLRDTLVQMKTLMAHTHTRTLSLSLSHAHAHICTYMYMYIYTYRTHTQECGTTGR